MYKSLSLGLLLSLSFFIYSCGGSEKSEQPETVEENIHVAPGMSNDEFNHLLNNVTNIEYLFIDYPISFSQSELNAVRQAVMFIEHETAFPDANCDPTAMVIFMGEGEILAEANVYFLEDCAYFVFEKDREPAYYHRLSQTGYQFYNQVLVNYFNQLQQQRQ
ncbi:MAG: hypothetical protein EA362_05910 [Saprospirales bacterium]|nr:MAG: hypothetical protein EA362_05910 [Saprospirales bacterium]